jgi:CheY-like chemotaxis protein
MKKRILLIDESLTVQKVVALTLDKGSYQVLYARNRQEVMKTIVDQPVDIILLSEVVPGLSWQSFPKELESWLGRSVTPPPVILISGQEMKEAKHYAAVLKKPFSPVALKKLVEEHVGGMGTVEMLGRESYGEAREDNLQKTFNRAFSDEDELVRQTFGDETQEDSTLESGADDSFLGLESPADKVTPMRKALPTTAAELWQTEGPKEKVMPPRVPGGAKENTEDLWGTQNNSTRATMEELNMMEQRSPVLTAEDSMAYKSVLENEVKSRIQNQDLQEMVERALSEMLPPMVERLVQERLDRLLKEHEESLAS